MWNTIHFTGLGCQIAAGLLGALSLVWVRTKNNHIQIAPELLKKAKTIGWIALAFFILGAILILSYEAHLI
jgi:hypothetical protein